MAHSMQSADIATEYLPNMKIAFSLVLIAFLSGLRLAAQPQFVIEPRINEILKSHGFPKGVVVLAEETAEGLSLCTNDPILARVGTVPASTFKIPNSLIGLETGVVTPGYLFKWDGKPRRLDVWEQDFDLAGAFKASCFWCYQEVARKVGKARMQHWLEQIGYGNMDLGGGIDKFWLWGKLRISPLEQVYFLHRLAKEQLPFSRANQATVRRMMLVEEREGRSLFGKTGWAQGKEDVGWFVGWVEGNGPRVFFATRLHAADPADSFMTARRAVTEDALRLLQYWK
jgi:beta-lactamase class D